MALCRVPANAAGRETRRACARVVAAVILLALACLLPACGPRVEFPQPIVPPADGTTSYDLDRDGRPDFFAMQDAAGRITRIGYDREGAGRPTQIINLDAIPAERCRHLAIALDGVPIDVLTEFYQQGHMRFCHPPATLISTYPAMTDPALDDAFGDIPCPAPEAEYYDPHTRRREGGTSDYLAGRNEPFARNIQYRAGSLDDALVYLAPRRAFESELVEVKRRWDRRESKEFVAYLVSVAGLGSRQGKAGQLYSLRRIEELCLQVLYETSGQVKITILSDHGQTNVACDRVDFEDVLRRKGWRPADCVRGERDVVAVKFGLVTFAAFGTRRPAKLAEDLLATPYVDLVSHVEGDKVIVSGTGGRASIHSTDGKVFRYECLSGDPLRLRPVLAAMESPARGGSPDPPNGEPALRGGRSGDPPPAPTTGPAVFVVDGRALLERTVAGRHEYPDALYRLWRAHFGLTENTPDVMASLKDRYYSGAGFFAAMVDMASTHGALNWGNSATFIMSSAGPIAGPLRSEDVPGAVGRLFDRPFPYRR